MLDLHCHLLPGIDDGAVDLDMALEMARMAVADGIRTVACTPHIYPGMYDNSGDGIRAAIAAFRLDLAAHDIDLQLVEGADVHLAPELLADIRKGAVPTLAGSRYLLLEPPHHVAPPRFEDAIFELMAAGIVPVITHPERLSWVEDHHEMFVRLARRGVWMQITAGALTGRFGKRVSPPTAAKSNRPRSALQKRFTGTFGRAGERASGSLGLTQVGLFLPINAPMPDATTRRSPTYKGFLRGDTDSAPIACFP